MGVLDFLKDSLRSSPKRVQEASAALAFPEGKRVGKGDTRLFRNWAEHSEWIRAAVQIRKTQVSSAEWDIVPADPNRQVDNKRLALRIKSLMEAPNARDDSFRSFIEPVIEDILVLDAGVVEKVPNIRGEVMELWPVDGGKVKVSAVWDGDPNEARYWFYPTGALQVDSQAVPFMNDEMVYIMANPRSYSVVGLSPLETLKLTVDSELSGSEYNRRQVTSAAPDGILNLGEDANQDTVDAFKAYWMTEVAGKGAVAFLGGTRNPDFIQFRSSNRDMQFLEWQIYLVRKIAAVFGLSPQDLGITMDVNRSTSEIQSEMTEDRGLRPLLSLIQDFLTREVVWDPAFGGQNNNLAFRFTSLNLKESTQRAQIDKLALAGIPWRTVNEVRIMEGREPITSEIGNQLVMATPVGAVSLEDVPTAREALEARKGAPGGGSSAGPAPKRPAKPNGGSPRPPN
jgi:HK97 family phage portal protein